MPGKRGISWGLLFFEGSITQGNIHIMLRLSNRVYKHWVQQDSRIGRTIVLRNTFYDSLLLSRVDYPSGDRESSSIYVTVIRLGREHDCKCDLYVGTAVGIVLRMEFALAIYSIVDYNSCIHIYRCYMQYMHVYSQNKELQNMVCVDTDLFKQVIQPYMPAAWPLSATETGPSLDW